MIDGALVAGNPFRGRFPGGVHQIQAFAPGYEPKVQQTSLATDAVVELSLDRRTRGPLSAAGRATPPTAQARTPLLSQGARLQQPRSPSPSSSRPGTGQVASPGISPPSVSATPAIPGLLTPPDVVDPRGGRRPMHPIEIRSPYKNP
jgi:hypothetical protein